ncbi:ABC-type multidrug transport system ATPase subunit [Hamadaea flava]|uniref:AAA family ATPase n=1 Tax=Hamadaea flava TaxID=1742688 RepID=A0ABV8LRD9_9ACTN|nr:AAA family ATPase [Hamadaea flava]MCP2322492.1 ABC-type multidrug transport system ATPase subunit [Hamadaea flava]
MYAQRIRPPAERSGARRLELSQPDGTYPGWVVITGPNGAGKSALLARMAAGDGEVVEPAPRVLAFYDSGRTLPAGDRVAVLLDDLASRAAADAEGLVLIDEPELHLDLVAQRAVGFRLKEAFPGVQFVVATHSPYACQAADVAIRLDPGRTPFRADDDLLHRVIFGSGDDAAQSELFGVVSPYSDGARRLREELVALEMAVLDGTATPAQAERFADLRALLTSSPEARSEEVRARLRRRAAYLRERRA